MTQRRIADYACHWLTLAATPVLATMAVITATHGGDHAVILYSGAHDASRLDGMTLMYLLMGAFHAPPWVRLLGNRLAG